MTLIVALFTYLGLIASFQYFLLSSVCLFWRLCLFEENGSAILYVAPYFVMFFLSLYPRGAFPESKSAICESFYTVDRML